MLVIPRSPKPERRSARRGAPGARWLVAGLTVALALSPALPVLGQGTLSALQTDVDQLSRRARPAVVTVFAEKITPRRDARPGTPPRVQARVGSGVAIDHDAVLTTASVVLGADRVVIRTSNALQAEGVVVGADPISNLALVRVASLKLPVIPFSTRPAQVGDWVVSLGTSYRAQPTQSVGNVAYRHHEPGHDLLQLTNTVYPGNSGAAALNPDGELVGLVQGELGAPDLLADAEREERRPSTASFVVPIESVRPIVESLRREGRVRHGFLGVTTRALSVASVRPGAPPTPIGALVEAIVPGSPAEQVGLRHGDLIVAYQHERVEYPEQLARWVSGTPPGQRIELVWAREEVAHSGVVTLTESHDVVPAWLATWPDDQDAPSAAKISQIEREIRRLNDELGRLKKPSR